MCVCVDLLWCHWIGKKNAFVCWQSYLMIVNVARAKFILCLMMSFIQIGWNRMLSEILKYYRINVYHKTRWIDTVFIMVCNGTHTHTFAHSYFDVFFSFSSSNSVIRYIKFIDFPFVSFFFRTFFAFQSAVHLFLIRSNNVEYKQ